MWHGAGPAAGWLASMLLACLWGHETMWNKAAAGGMGGRHRERDSPEAGVVPAGLCEAGGVLCGQVQSVLLDWMRVGLGCGGRGFIIWIPGAQLWEMVYSGRWACALTRVPWDPQVPWLQDAGCSLCFMRQSVSLATRGERSGLGIEVYCACGSQSQAAH